MTTSDNTILTATSIQKKIERIAYEIYEQNSDEKEIILAGIIDRGNIVAKKIREILEKIAPFTIITFDIMLDKTRPLEVEFSKRIDFTNKVIILVDDVANSGRTLLYAIKPLLEYLPKKIQTAVLIDRQHKSFPLQVDYRGYSLATTLQDIIMVEVEGEKIGKAYLL
jgi:pyrimidine operon attenuation protein / uracil phosphoribosyltransferase